MIEDWKEQLEETDKRAGEAARQGFNKLLLGKTDELELFQVLGKERILNWIGQFETELEKKAAFTILTKIQYYNSSDIMNLCRINFYQWLIRNDANIDETVFIELGGTGKSGSMIGYLFRISNDLPTDKVFSEQDIITADYECIKKMKHIVFLDDFSGSGDQFVEESIASKLIEKAEELSCKLTFSFLPLAITSHAKIKIESTLGVEVISQQIRKKPEYSEAENHVIERYGKGLFVINDKDLYRGWGGCAETVVFFYSVPNNSLPILWSEGTSNAVKGKWKPLFHRMTIKEKSNSESIDFLSSLLIQNRIYSEDYMMHMRVIVEAFGELKPRMLSLTELRDYLYIASCIMHPFNYVVTYHSPFMFLSDLRKKTMKIVKEKIEKEKISENEMIHFFTADYPVVEQGTLVIFEYSEMVKDCIVRENRTVNAFLDIINKTYNETGTEAFEVYGVFCTIWKVMEARNLLVEEIDKLIYLRGSAKNEVIKYYVEITLSQIESRKVEFSDIDLKQCYVIVNNYGKYKVMSVEDKMESLGR